MVEEPDHGKTREDLHVSKGSIRTRRRNCEVEATGRSGDRLASLSAERHWYGDGAERHGWSVRSQ